MTVVLVALLLVLGLALIRSVCLLSTADYDLATSRALGLSLLILFVGALALVLAAIAGVLSA